MSSTKKHLLPPAPTDYEPNDILINRNWSYLGWPRKKVRAYEVYSFPQYQPKKVKTRK